MSNEAQIKHYLDIALQQSVMISFAIPVVGAPLAAGFSILDAILNETKVSKLSTANYSVEAAFAQLYKDLKKLLDSQSRQNTDAVISACLAGAEADQHTIDYALSDPKFWDDTMKLRSLEQSVSNFHSDLGNSSIMKAFKLIEGTDGEDKVKYLDMYMIGRTNFQTQCVNKLKIQAIVLQQQAKLKGKTISLPEYYDTHCEIIDDMLDNASAAISFTETTLLHLEKVFATHITMAHDIANKAHPQPGLERQRAFTSAMRHINSTEHLAFTSVERVKKMLKLVKSFQRTYLLLKTRGIDSVKNKQRDAITNTKPSGYDPLGS